LFTDITGFSEVASKLRLQDTVSILSEYYSRLLQFAITRGGKLEEYLGDGLYISFFNEVEGQAARGAVATGIEMQPEYAKMLHGWMEYQHPFSDQNTHRIGIATGSVYTGFVGHPHERRNKLVGSPVNLASHLCQDLKKVGGGIAICQSTKELIGDEWPTFNSRSLPHGKAWTIST
jgi:class 3 adenylate cyclase